MFSNYSHIILKLFSKYSQIILKLFSNHSQNSQNTLKLSNRSQIILKSLSNRSQKNLKSLSNRSQKHLKSLSNYSQSFPALLSICLQPTKNPFSNCSYSPFHHSIITLVLTKVTITSLFRHYHKLVSGYHHTPIMMLLLYYSYNSVRLL